MKKLSSFLLTAFLSIMLLCPVSALAIPNLGVASGSGFYNGPYEAYLDTFADYFVSGLGTNAGFVMPDGDGSISLTVWYGSDSGLSVTDKGVNVFLATNSANGVNFTFDGNSFGDFSASKQIDGYHPQVDPTSDADYNTVSLGFINDTSGNWNQISDSAWNSGSKEFWAYTGVLNYTNFQPTLASEPIEWMFAIADMNGDWVYDEPTIEGGKLTGGEFSPKTTSSFGAPIPEPATMLLLGTGLIGMAGFRRKKFKK